LARALQIHHVGYFGAIWAIHVAAFGSQTVASRVTCKLSWRPFHSWTVCVANEFLVWCQRSFFSLSSLIAMSSLLDFQSNFLKWFIELEFVFNFILLDFFYLSNLISFFKLLFVLFVMIFRYFFYNFAPLQFFYYQIWSSFFWLLVLFFLWIFFLISYFNIKLIGNRVSWLSPSLEFHGLWIWKINQS